MNPVLWVREESTRPTTTRLKLICTPTPDRPHGDRAYLFVTVPVRHGFVAVAELLTAVDELTALVEHVVERP